MNTDPLLTISFWLGLGLTVVGSVAWMISLAIVNKKWRNNSEGIMLGGLVVSLYSLGYVCVGLIDVILHNESAILEGTLKAIGIL